MFRYTRRTAPQEIGYRPPAGQCCIRPKTHLPAKEREAAYATISASIWEPRPSSCSSWHAAGCRPVRSSFQGIPALPSPQTGWSEQNPARLVLSSRWCRDCTSSAWRTATAVRWQASASADRCTVWSPWMQRIRSSVLPSCGTTDAPLHRLTILNQTIGKQQLSEYTANIAFAGFTAPKILWMKENEPQKFARICKIMLPKDYLIYRLSGNFATDYSDASGMLRAGCQKTLLVPADAFHLRHHRTAAAKAARKL